MKRWHEIPFGVDFSTEDHLSETRFCLWAPSAGRVEVVVEGELLPMSRGDDGFHTLVTHRAESGTRYLYRIDGEHEVPDPASRFQPDDLHGPSMVVDPEEFDWSDADWKGRPWRETVLYELHVGTFSPEGTYSGVKERLDYLQSLGVTAIELMPLSDFPGARNWGYDGVLPYAPDSSYGSPEDLKDLVQSAHEKGLSVFLDVVYNHFGPEGNYLDLYAPDFFTDRHETPWGAAINLDSEGGEHVREFFLHNALYWLEEYHFDGLRLDAVHAIHDDSRTHFLTELARRVENGPGRERHIHLILENEENEASRLDGEYTAQWNDDVHHALHVTLTGEDAAYYSDYADAPVGWLAKGLAEGFAYQGEPSRHRGNRRGEPSGALPPTKFVAFLQNHDQVGNRAFGDRISTLADPEAVRAAVEVYLLAPQIPMLFMGEEWAASTPFLFFCDFEPGLAPLVSKGRREEFERFPEFSDPEFRERIPDPGDPQTFASSKLFWREREEPDHRPWLDLYEKLLTLRRREIFHRLRDLPGGESARRLVGDRGLRVQWTLGEGSLLTLLANLGDETLGGFEGAPGEPLHTTNDAVLPDADGFLPPWSVAWYIKGANNDRG